jgi:hypothetical protein
MRILFVQIFLVRRGTGGGGQTHTLSVRVGPNRPKLGLFVHYRVRLSQPDHRRHASNSGRGSREWVRFANLVFSEGRLKQSVAGDAPHPERARPQNWVCSCKSDVQRPGGREQSTIRPISNSPVPHPQIGFFRKYVQVVECRESVWMRAFISWGAQRSPSCGFYSPQKPSSDRPTAPATAPPSCQDSLLPKICAPY